MTRLLLATTLVAIAALLAALPALAAAPVVTVPADMTVEATSGSGAAVTFSTSVTDSDGDAGPVLCTPSSGSTFSLGTTTVSCSSTDAAHNTDTETFDVTVVDTTGPVFSSVPSNQTAEATSSSGAVVNYSLPTATDAVDGDRTVSCSPSSGSTFALGDTTVACTASDTRSNTATAAFTVTVQDTTGPAFSNVPGTQTVEATSPSGAAVSYTAPTATDLVDGARGVSCSPASGATFPLGMTTVSCSASDTRGNTGGASFVVSIVDTTPPAFSGVPTAVTAEATGAAGASVQFAVPTATDIVDGSRFVGCTYAPGNIFPLGQTTVSCSASDTRGNSASVSFTVTVVDTTPPVLSLPGAIVRDASSDKGAGVTFLVSALDAVDGKVRPQCNATSGTLFRIGTTTVTCKAQDAAGNTASASFTIHVRGADEQISALGISTKGTKQVVCSRLSTDARRTTAGVRRSRINHARELLGC
jgi:hypothetical protein